MNGENEDQADNVLFKLMPDALLDAAKKQGNAAAAASLPCYFPDADRAKWDARLTERLL